MSKPSDIRTSRASQPRRLLTTKQLAKRIGKSERTVRNMIHDGRVKAVPIGESSGARTVATFGIPEEEAERHEKSPTTTGGWRRRSSSASARTSNATP